MKFYRVLIAGLATLALVGSAFAQTDIGRSGAQFLKISPSARAVSLGGAYGAIAKGADAMYHNPAALTGVKGIDIHLSHVAYVADVNLNYVALAMPALKGVVGMHFGALTTDDMLVTTITDPTGELGTTFEVGSWVAGLSYATSLTDRLSLGVTAKYVHETIWDMESGAVAFDVGTLYYTGFSNWRFSAALLNFGPQATFSGGQLVTEYDKYNNEEQAGTLAEDTPEPYDLPLTFKLSTAYDFVITDQMMVTTTLEGAHPSDALEYVAGGLEYSLNAGMVSVALRGGYRVVQTETMGSYKDMRTSADGAVAGIGVGVPFIAKKLAFDYTWQDYTKLGTNHLFSLSMSF